MQIAATPYIWPYDGAVDPAKTALMIIDMQTDFFAARAVTSREWVMTSH
ncbi:hypothetical protein ACFTAO_45130 [Paenibacillus rhizoplanae]